MKNCPKCNTTKPIEEFAIKSSIKNTRHTNCKACHNTYGKTHYENNKPAYLKKAVINRKNQYWVNRTKVEELKAKSGCTRCTEKDPCCLDFHHTSDDKDFCISSKLACLSWATLLIEINKCIIVCANCHRKIHAGKL